MVLVDMVGDRNLNIRRESDSTPLAHRHRLGRREAPRPRRRVPGRADRSSKTTTSPFLEAGVPAVDIIDLDYPAWHTADDTLDNVSARSLQTVGDVLLAALPQIETRLRRR